MSNIVYLISSLPSLTFGESPPISLDSFYNDAKEQLSSRDFHKLHELDLQNINESDHSNLKNFVNQIESFKEDLLEIRNAKINNRTPLISSIPKTILDQNPLEREKSIMKWQWEQLSDIEAGEVFTITELFVYKLKLQILHRLQSFNESKGFELLESIVNPPKKMEES